jgi:hypothetical protein
MKAGTYFIILLGAAGSVLCVAEPPGVAPTAAQASSAPVQVTSGALQISSAPVQITLAAPRAAPDPAASNTAATQNVLPGPLPEIHGSRGDYVGYTRVMVSGHELYCRNDVATGSRTERHTVCLTAAQVVVQQAKAKKYVEDVQYNALAGPSVMGGQGGVMKMGR